LDSITKLISMSPHYWSIVYTGAHIFYVDGSSDPGTLTYTDVSRNIGGVRPVISFDKVSL